MNKDARLSDENNFKGSEVASHLEDELLYFVKFLKPLGASLHDIVSDEKCTKDYFGVDNGGIRKRCSRFIELIRKSPNKWAPRLREVSCKDAPVMSSIHQARKMSSNESTSDGNFSLDKSNRSDSSESFELEEQQPRAPSYNRMSRSMSPYSSPRRSTGLPLKGHDWRNGIPSGGGDYGKLVATLQACNHIVYLDPDHPELNPPGLDITIVRGSLDANEEYAWDKYVILLPLLDQNSLKCIRAELSKDGRAIIVQWPAKERFFLQFRDQVVDSVARCLKAGEDEKDELTASALGVTFGTLHENCTDKFQDEEFDEKLPMTKRIIVLPEPGCNTAFNEDDNGEKPLKRQLETKTAFSGERLEIERINERLNEKEFNALKGKGNRNKALYSLSSFLKEKGLEGSKDTKKEAGQGIKDTVDYLAIATTADDMFNDISATQRKAIFAVFEIPIKGTNKKNAIPKNNDSNDGLMLSGLKGLKLASVDESKSRRRSRRF